MSQQLATSTQPSAPHDNSDSSALAEEEEKGEHQHSSFYYYSWSADGSEIIRRMSIESDFMARPTHSDAVQMRDMTPSSHTRPIDETHTPKQLTTLVTDKLVKKFSGTHLADLQTELGGNVGGLGAISESNVSLTPTPKGGGLKETKVLVLYTGGTIGMKCNNKGLSGVYSPQQHYLPRAIRELPPLNDKEYVEENYADVQVKPYALPPLRGMNKRVIYWLVEYEPLLDSSDMTFDDWIRIAKDIHKSYSAYDGFVVLHGTDTLAYTACALSFMMQNLGKPVVVTGAQIPVAEVRSDGRENFIGALIVAGNLDIPEVTVLFNNKLMRGNRVTKLDSSALEAFHSPNLTPLATMDISINVNYESIFRSPEVAPFSIHENLCRNVVVLRVFPSMPIESVRALLREPTQGVVLQTFGCGNMPSRRADILSEITSAVRRGCLVINVSQCVKGYVNLNYANGKIVADAGVIPGSDMTTEAALTKLAYVLSKDEWDPVTKNLMMQRNIRGELTVTRSEHLDELDIIPRLAKFLCVTSSAETRLLRNAMFPPLVCHAAHANDVKLLENLRLSGANVTSVDYNCRTALHVAAAAGSLDAVTYLLKHGVSVHSRDSGDENAMMCAVRSKNLKVIKAILQAGGQIVATPQRIGVEMCLAAGMSDIQALKAWSEAKVDLSTADYDGRTALHVASAKGLEEVVRFLCANGASPQAKDHFGRTPLDECSNSVAALGAEKDHSTDISVLDSKLQNISSILRNFMAK